MTAETVAPNMVVSINYVLTDETGAIVDQSNGEPLDYLQGHGNIIPGLEKELTGLRPGDKKKVVVQPEEGYGPYVPDLRFSIPAEQFSGITPQPGMSVQLQSPEGAVMARILGVENQQVLMDANHPLAGKVLTFDVEVTGVRPASQEEMAHGHPHGPHGHHH